MIGPGPQPRQTPKRMRYVGPLPLLYGKTALVGDIHNAVWVVAQFDDIEGPQAYGWWPHKKADFERLNTQ